MSCYVVGTGAALPERVVTNAELAARLGVTPEWIEASSGIRERRWVGAGQSTSDLGAAASRAALHDAGLSGADVDYVIGGTLSPDYQVPGVAPLVERGLEGCRQVPAVDVRVGCAAILYGLQLACGLIESRAAGTVLCFGAEAQSKGLDVSERSAEITMLFGDGAGALVLSREPRGGSALRVDDVLIRTDGNFAEDLLVRAPGTANGARWTDAEQRAQGLHRPLMNGRRVILHAVRKLADAAAEITARRGLTPADVDVIVPHQANANLLRQLAKKLNLDERRVVTNLERYGNTSGASAFIALDQARREHYFRPGARALILAFGAGFTWGAALLNEEVPDAR
jgi:3-oxoacyl-[acyl-carrier-protein] synthase III